MPYHADSTEFNTKVPSIHIEIEGKTSISPNDVAGLVYSTSTSTKTIKFYIRLKEANTVYQINPEQRYGRSFTTSYYSATTSYFYFIYASTSSPVTSLPTPAQGSIVYAVKRTIDADTLNGKFAEDFALRNHTHTIANITDLQSTLDAKAPLASPNFTGVPTVPTAPNGTNTDQIATTKFVQNALSVGGYGDMLKSQYDTDSDGIVDRAETADKLTTARNINGVAFDGSADITIEDSTKVDKDGDTMVGKLTLPASTTTEASINIPHGTAPTSPVNGDIWTTTSAPLIRINGTTRTIYHNGNASTAALTTVSQADAEEGTSTTVRAWTALRVRQAIEAVSPYYAGITPPSNTKKIWIDTN